MYYIYNIPNGFIEKILKYYYMYLICSDSQDSRENPSQECVYINHPSICNEGTCSESGISGTYMYSNAEKESESLRNAQS
jgi:hypothetical protein